MKPTVCRLDEQTQDLHNQKSSLELIPLIIHHLIQRIPGRLCLQSGVLLDIGNAGGHYLVLNHEGVQVEFLPTITTPSSNLLSNVLYVPSSHFTIRVISALDSEGNLHL